MKLTRFSDYALRVLIYLALEPRRVATIQEVATAYDISKNHLMKVVHTLSRLGYVDATRGQGGGMRLASAPEKINLGALIRATEEDFALAECFQRGNRCVITPACRLKTVLHDALKAFLGVLDDYNLRDLVDDRAQARKLNTILFSPPPPAKADTRAPRRART